MYIHKHIWVYICVHVYVCNLYINMRVEIHIFIICICVFSIVYDDLFSDKPSYEPSCINSVSCHCSHPMLLAPQQLLLGCNHCFHGSIWDIYIKMWNKVECLLFYYLSFSQTLSLSVYLSIILICITCVNIRP